MTLTLTRERRKKFQGIIAAWICHSKAITDVTGDDNLLEDEIAKLADQLAEAAQSRTEAQKEEVITASDKKVDAIIELAKQANAKEEAGQAWRGREILAPQYHKYGDWWHKITGLHMYSVKGKAKVNTDWLKAFKEWDDNELTIESLQSAYDVENGWRKEKSGQPQNITTPSQLTAKALTIQAAPVVVSTNREEGKSSGYFA